MALLLYRAFFPAPAGGPSASGVDPLLGPADAPPQTSPAGVYQEILPSLVFVEAELPVGEGETVRSVGSAVIVNDAGDILTSWHVIANAVEIRLTFTDGTQSGALVTEQKPEIDIAVLRASQPPLQFIPATLGNPDSLRIGDPAFVVGHPMGLFGSLTVGVISGLNRAYTPMNSNQELSGLIQVDAAVNPGSSGGPLLNRDGQVIGIIAALANPTQQDFFVGIGFAVPIHIAGEPLDLPSY